MNSDVVSVGSLNSGVSSIQPGQFTSQKYAIELNIKLLFSDDPQYFGQAFKIYWSRNNKKIDTRVGLMKPETQVAKFNDKFQMKTVLQQDKESGEFKDKLSIL